MLWSRYRGSVDIIRNDRIAGWVWNGRAPGERLEVVVRLGNTDLLETSACLYRSDLADAGIGDGFHAFDVWLTERVSDREMSSIRVNVKGTRYRLPISRGAIERRTPKDNRSIYDGWVGLISNDHVAGWVWNGCAPEEKLKSSFIWGKPISERRLHACIVRISRTPGSVMDSTRSTSG